MKNTNDGSSSRSGSNGRGGVAVEKELKELGQLDRLYVYLR